MGQILFIKWLEGSEQFPIIIEPTAYFPFLSVNDYRWY